MRATIFNDELKRLKIAYAARALLECGLNRTRAAAVLKMQRKTLAFWAKQYGLKTLEDCVARALPGPIEITVREAYRRYERSRIEDALTAHNENRSATARALGIGRRTLITKIRLHGLEKLEVKPSYVDPTIVCHGVYTVA